MPRRAQPPDPNRIQTLREARRAYQKAGRTPSLTTAQIRAAERAAEGEKRAKKLLEKERQVKQNKRKREEQEDKQHSEKKKLVELGKLPEESLWGNVRSSQPRLHNFFGFLKHAGKETGTEETPGPADINLDEDELKAEDVNTKEDSALLEKLISSPQTSQKTSNGCHGCAAEVRKNISGESLDKIVSLGQGTLVGVSGSRTQSDLHLFPSDSQLLTELVDDAALESELNGHPAEGNVADDRVQYDWTLQSQYADDATLETELNGYSANTAQNGVRGFPCGTQESEYGLDGVDDKDLASLVDTFENKG